MGGRFKRERVYVYLRLIHVDLWQKPSQYCSDYPPIKNTIKNLKIVLSHHLSGALATATSLKTTPRPTTHLCLSEQIIVPSTEKAAQETNLSPFSPWPQGMNMSKSHSKQRRHIREVNGFVRTRNQSFQLSSAPQLGPSTDGGRRWPILTYIFLNKPIR